MISIGKHRGDQRRCDALVTKPHGLEIRALLMDLDHNVKKDLTPFFADGQVSVDADADVTRGLDLTLLDPLRKVQIDFDDPTDTGVYLTDMLRVYYVMTDPEAPNVLNIDGTFETSWGGWIQNTGSARLAPNKSYYGFQSLFISVMGSENYGYFNMNGLPGSGTQNPTHEVGKTYSASIWVNSTTTQTLAFHNYGDSPKVGPSKVCTAGVWTRLTVTFTAGTNVYLSVRDPTRSRTIDPIYMDGYRVTLGSIDRGDGFDSPTYVIPVFTGPVSGVERDDITLMVKALGKESLGLTNMYEARVFKKGMEKLHCIKIILRDFMGETKMDIPDTIRGKSPRLPNDMKLSREDTPWAIAKKIAASMNVQLFYDGRGIAVLRQKKTGAVWKITEDHVTAEPSISYDLSTTINAVRVIGGIPKKHKKPVKAKAVAQRSHPLSPWKLGRTIKVDGTNRIVPRYLWMEIQDDSLLTVAECKAVAKSHLKHGLIGGVTITADGIVNPRLQELDIVRVHTENTIVTLPLRQFTIPLTAGTAGSIGYLRKMTPKNPPKKHRRRHHHRHHRSAA